MTTPAPAAAPHPAPAKPDDLFGVCAALGEEFGFDPLWLRIALATSLLWNPVAVIAGYATAGLAVWLVRRLVPDRVAQPASDDGAITPREAENDTAEWQRAA